MGSQISVLCVGIFDATVSAGFVPSPGKKALQVGADHVRQLFGYFEFYDSVPGVHLKNSGERFRRLNRDGYVGYLVHVVHQRSPQVLKFQHPSESEIPVEVSG
jgi:hypothetical protein